MKNVAICYHGGCGGHFIFYYLLASNRFSHKNKHTNSLLKEKHIKNQFYFQFKEKGNWLDYEIWPENQYQEKNQLFHCCDFVPEKDIDCIKICPYISNFRDWFKTVLYKKTNIFRNKNTLSVNLVKKIYKEKLVNMPKLKIKNCDYYFDLIKFVHDYKERKKLCRFLDIQINDTMEEFVEYYKKLHVNLKKTSWILQPMLTDNQEQFTINNSVEETKI
jgi:hypothetical protein